VSSREAYLAPDRGTQGNALKTIVARPFVLDGERGRVDIFGDGVLHEMEIAVDRLRQRPKAELARSDYPGSSVRVHWPVRPEVDGSLPVQQVAGSLDRDDADFSKSAPTSRS
jgi:hypothetical protein